MHRLVPDFIIERYRAGEYQGHFNAVGLFLDVSGFATMTDTLMQHGAHGAEVLGTIMRGVFDPLLQTIFGQGGAIIGLAGDGMMALYPFEPDQAEDQALLHALASAWNMQHILKTSPIRQTVYGDFPISAKIGLAVGRVEWGILHDRQGERATYYFRGPAVDAASNAEHQARAGEIVLTAELCDCFDGLVTQARQAYCLLEDLTIPLPPAQPVELPPVDVAITRRFLPDLLFDGGLESEFRQAVNLFLRFPAVRDEDLPTLAHIIFDLQSRYGGLFTRFDFGDKGCNTLLFWGAPLAHQNDIGRALNFVTDLQEQIEFPLQAGVTYHISRAGYMGGELFEDYTCYGWGINLASRFMMNSEPGQVWVDERVAQRANRRFAFEFISEQRFKGFAQKQKVYLLKGRKPQVEVLYEGDLVGRQAELAALDALIAPLRQGKAAAPLLIWGEPGVGKSRLLYEWIRTQSPTRQPLTFAVCQSDQVLQQSFNPFRYWLRQYFGVNGNGEAVTGEAAVARQSFDERMERLLAATLNPALAAELDRLRSVLAALVGLRWPDSLYEQLDPQARYDNTLLALTRMIEAESLRCPLVLIFEDAHYFDEDTLLFLPRLLRALNVSPFMPPVVLLLTARRQGAALRLDPALTARAFELECLKRSDLLNLAGRILEGPIAPDLAELLETRAEGNPFFAEQLLRYLRDQNLIEWSVRGWRVLTAWNAAMLPADISTMIVARLDQLAREVRAVIQTAAVLGREFEVLVLAHMLRDDKNLPLELDEAERAAIWSPMSEIRYLFKHALVRDAAYNMQMQARRAELHALAVEALEKLFTENPLTQIENLAYHSETAGLDEKAVSYLERAGNAARDVYQNQRAEDFYTRALALTPQDDLETRFRLLAARESMRKLHGQPAARLQDIEEMQRIAESLHADEKMLFALIRLAEYFTDMGHYPRAEQTARQTLVLAEKVQHTEEIIIAGYKITEALYRQGQYPTAILQCQRFLELAKTAGYPLHEANLLNTLGLLFLETREMPAAIQTFEKSAALFDQLHHVRNKGMALNNLGLAATYQGNYAAAQHYYEQARLIYLNLGNQRNEGNITGNLGWLSGLQGNYEQARFYIERSGAIAHEMGDSLGETFALINLSATTCVLGEMAAAQRAAEEALHLARQSHDRNAEAWALTYAGHAWLDGGERASAEEAYQQAIRIRQELNQPVLCTEPRAGLLRLALAQQNHERLAAGLTEILPILESHPSLDGTDEPLRVYLYCCQALLALGDARAAALLAQAQELLKQRAANIADAAARQRFLEQVPWNRELDNMRQFSCC
jgi:predicted ATPase/class 3 adenylate cyclase